MQGSRQLYKKCSIKNAEINLDVIRLKKIATFVLVFLILNLFDIVSAASRNSTATEMKYALTQAVISLRKTDNFFDSLKKENYEILVKKIYLCNLECIELKYLKNSSKVGGKEAKTCIAFAQLIQLHRYLALSNLRDAIKAAASGNHSEHKKYQDEAVEYMNSASELRQQFRNVYGY